MLHFDSSHPTVTRGSRVSRAPPLHTLPAFLNINDRKTKTFLNKKIIFKIQIFLTRLSYNMIFYRSVKIIYKNV